MPASLQASGTVLPWLSITSIWRSLATICSGVNVFFGMFPVPFCIPVSLFDWYKKARSGHHIWMPNLAPSEKLLRDIQTGVLSWAAFTRRYRAELFQASAIDRKNKTIKNHGQKFTLRLLQTLAK